MWGNKKSKGGANGFDWKQLLVETNGTVLGYAERFNTLEAKQKDCHKETSEGRRELREHCNDEVKDRAALKDHICKKIDKRFDAFECPDKLVIADLKQGRTDLVAVVKDYKESVDTFVTEIRDERTMKAGEAKAWKKLWIRVGYSLGGVGTITGITTRIMGLW